MALPPTRLKNLLQRLHGADEIFDGLVEAGCLNRHARRNRDGFDALVAEARAKFEAHYQGSEDMCGPSHLDFLADGLEAAGVLSRRGRRWAEEMAE